MKLNIGLLLFNTKYTARTYVKILPIDIYLLFHSCASIFEANLSKSVSNVKENTDPYLNALKKLRTIGAAINSVGSVGLANVEVASTLKLIVESAVEVVPGSSAVIYTYDESSGRFDHTSRVSAEGLTNPTEDDLPRSNGIGSLTVSERRRVLSYEEPELQIHPAKVAVGAKIMACYPLIVSAEVFGVLYLYLHEKRPLSNLELLMLDNFVNHAAMVLYVARQHSWAIEREVRKGKELRRLRRSGMLISSRSNLQGTLDAILRMALEVMDAEYGIFRLIDIEGENLITKAFFGEGLDQPALEPLPINRQSIMRIVALDREPVVISDLRDEPWCDVYYPLDHNREMRSEMAVPLIGAGDRLEGMLNLESPQPNAFNKQDRYILQIFATQAVVAIQEARLLGALQEISAFLLSHSQQDVLDRVVARACDLLNVNVGLLWAIDDCNLVLQSSTDQHLVGNTLGVDDSLTGKVILSSQPVVSYDVSKDPRFARKDLAEHFGWGSALIVPIITSGDDIPLGALSIYTSTSDLRNFEEAEWEKKVLTILGHYASLAIQNAAHQEAMRVAQEQRTMTEAFAAIGDIASNLMHQLNNKIGTIPVRIEGIQDKSQFTLEQDTYLNSNLTEIENSATEAINIVRESLFHLRPIRLSSVEIQESIETALTTLKLPDDIKVVQQELEFLPLVHACPKRLPLVFVNLLENAVRAMGGQGEIEISGLAYGEWVQIRVRDTGPGIPSELHDQIFEFNYSSNMSGFQGNLGFGLWWVKTLITRFGGRVSVESDGHSGTTFILEFPRMEVEA